MSDMNNIFKFQDILRIFTRVRTGADGQTDRQTECINTFQLCWKVLKKENVFFSRKNESNVFIEYS